MQNLSTKLPKSSFIEEFVVRSWWVFLFILIAAIWCHQAVSAKSKEIADLEFRLDEIKKEKSLVLAEKEDLSLKINSQDDTEWMEQVLMKELGLVPDGYVKVHFIKE